MLARTIMVQGTASSVGKSIVVTALCRLFRQRGLRVAPFKSQNMALNSFVTPDGGEIGRAQAVQAEAARVVPTVDMNPILLKPEGDAHSQVVLMGKPIGRMGAMDYHEVKPTLRSHILASLTRLREAHDVVVIEGAGSPAEINLRDRDLVNMHVARVADAPVLLVGDIDRGGVFAAFVGTMELLEPEDRARVAAFVVNKFRGDVRLLEPGLRFLENRTGVPVLGVLPYLTRLRIADEDSVSLEDRRRRTRATPSQIDVAVVRLPRISNYDDFAPLEHEPDVIVRFVDQRDELEGADLVVLPGTKSTLEDLAWLRASGMAEAITARAQRGGFTLGICGGCQMLGGAIFDPHRVEVGEAAATEGRGLGLLGLSTRFARTKTTAQVRAHLASRSFLGDSSSASLVGYEIHMGHVERDEGVEPAFELTARNGAALRVHDGAVGMGGAVLGTMIHGLFDDDERRGAMLAKLAEKKCLSPRAASHSPPKDDAYDRLAAWLRENLDNAALDRIVGL